MKFLHTVQQVNSGRLCILPDAESVSLTPFLARWLNPIASEAYANVKERSEPRCLGGQFIQATPELLPSYPMYSLESTELAAVWRQIVTWETIRDWQADCTEYPRSRPKLNSRTAPKTEHDPVL
jgi:hypothetical protein